MEIRMTGVGGSAAAAGATGRHRQARAGTQRDARKAIGCYESIVAWGRRAGPGWRPNPRWKALVCGGEFVDAIDDDHVQGDVGDLIKAEAELLLDSGEDVGQVALGFARNGRR